MKYKILVKGSAAHVYRGTTLLVICLTSELWRGKEEIRWMRKERAYPFTRPTFQQLVDQEQCVVLGCDREYGHAGKHNSTERKRQALHPQTKPYVIHCSDGEVFRCDAVSESGAERVLNAERPGIIPENIEEDTCIHTSGQCEACVSSYDV